MSFLELGAVGEFVGGIAVIVTLIYLALQLKKSSESAFANAYAASQSISLQSEDMLIRLAPVWVKLKNGEQLTDEEEFQIDRAIEARHNMAFYSFARNKALRQGSHEVPVERFASFLADNQLLKLSDSVTGFGAEWSEILDRYLEVLDDRPGI
jgi:hypothetical protein